VCYILHVGASREPNPASNSTDSKMAKRFIIIAGAFVLIAAVVGGTIGSSKRLRRTVSIGGPTTDRPAEEIKQGTIEAICRLTATAAKRTPAVLVVEDLHWIDPTTMELLVLLVNQVATMRLFALLTTRLDFRSPWGSAEGWSAWPWGSSLSAPRWGS